MKVCVFLGPTLPHSRVPKTIDVYGPATLGSVYKVLRAGYTRIGIVDGLFGPVPSVWHKEILFAISQGAIVYGAASLGALRAAELHVYGMQGVGRVYRMFRSGVLTDDDEVAVVHGPTKFGYSPLSESMVNVRFTLNRMRKAGVISREVEMAANAQLKSVYFAKRTLEGLLEYLCGLGIPGDLKSTLAKYYFDVKADDAMRLLDRMISDRAPAARDRLWRFLPTKYWSIQFDKAIDDIPDLELLGRAEPARSFDH